MKDLQSPRRVGFRNAFPCEVDYDIPLRKRLEENGIRCLNHNLPHFKAEPTGKGLRKVTIKLFRPRKKSDTKTVLAKIHRKKARPASIEEVITMRLSYPIRLTGSIVGLGSIHRERLMVPYIFRWEGKLRLGFTRPDTIWADWDYFAYVEN